jgi:hypothetical protein
MKRGKKGLRPGGRAFLAERAEFEDRLSAHGLVPAVTTIRGPRYRDTIRVAVNYGGVLILEWFPGTGSVVIRGRKWPGKLRSAAEVADLAMRLAGTTDGRNAYHGSAPTMG